MSDEYVLGQYLLDRLAHIGVDCIFGVPGDFNLAFLDLIVRHPKIKWVGTCNELNAGYAADGYARTTGKPGVILTTWGVGELSAVNALAGAYAENIPIVHLVGAPSTALQKKKVVLHHTLGDGHFDAFANMHKPITVAQVALTPEGAHSGSAIRDLDATLRQAVEKARPVHVSLPTDAVFCQVDRPSRAMNFAVSAIRHTQALNSDPDGLDSAMRQIQQLYTQAQKPALLIDVHTARYGMLETVKELIAKTQIPFFTTPMAKGLLDETDPCFSGVYLGRISMDPVREALESCDLVFWIGALKSDFNTGAFTHLINQDQCIELLPESTKVQHGTFDGLSFRTTLPALLKHLPTWKSAGSLTPLGRKALAAKPDSFEGDTILQDEFWPTVSATLQPKDVIIAEAGTSLFGILDVQLPSQAIYISQLLWASIGFAAGATLGAAVAAQMGRRTILFTGDGSLQLTIQDLSTMIRLGLKPIIFVINNNGYTVERLIHGADESYNDIPQFQWQQTLPYFGAKDGQSKSYSIRTPKELQDLLADGKFQAAEVIQFVEVHMHYMDAPRALKLQASRVTSTNAGPAKNRNGAQEVCMMYMTTVM